MSKLSFRIVKDELADLYPEIHFSRVAGSDPAEYLVSLRGNDHSAYFTNELSDAYETAMAMASEGLKFRF